MNIHGLDEGDEPPQQILSSKQSLGQYCFEEVESDSNKTLTQDYRKRGTGFMKHNNRQGGGHRDGDRYESEKQHIALKSHLKIIRQARETFQMVGQGSPRDSQNNTEYTCSPWLALQEEGALLLTTLNRIFRTQASDDSNRSDLKASFLWSTFRCTRKSCASCQGRKAIKQSYPAATPMNHDKEQHSKLS